MVIRRYDKEVYWFRRRLAVGRTASGEDYTVAISADDKELLFMLPEGTYTLQIDELAYTVIALREPLEEVKEKWEHGNQKEGTYLTRWRTFWERVLTKSGRCQRSR